MPLVFATNIPGLYDLVLDDGRELRDLTPPQIDRVLAGERTAELRGQLTIRSVVNDLIA